MYPNVDLRAHLTIWGAAFAGCLAVFLTLAAPVWVWLPGQIWLVLWGCAILALHADAYWPARLVTILRDPDFKQVYQWVTVPFLARVWRRLCDHNPASSSAAATFGAALTARLYDRALLIAVAYPFLLPVLIWVATGRAGQMGPVTFLPGTDAWDVWPERAGMVAVFAIFTAGFVAQMLASASPRRVVGQAADWLPIGAFAVAVAVAAAGALAGAGAGAFAFALAAAGAFALAGALAGAFAAAGAFALAVALAVAVAAAGAFAGALAGALAVALAVAGAFAVAFLANRGHLTAGLLLATAWPVAVMIGLAAWLPWDDVADERAVVFVFLGVFPLINGLFDALSYAVTLALMRLGLRRWNPVWAAVADVAFALVLFLAVGAALVAAIAGLNRLAGVPILDLGALFARVHEDPGSHLWVFLMLFSTALPTLIHGTLALLGAQKMVPGVLRRGTVQLIGAAPHGAFPAVFAPMALALVGTIPFVMVAALLWGLWHFGKGAILAGVGHYGDALLWIALAIGAF